MWFNVCRRVGLCCALATITTAAAADDSAVRRYEWVVTLRARAKATDAIGNAELAAGRAGGAVLENVRIDATRRYTDHRLLVRTGDHESIGAVLSGMRATKGVVGATAVALPQTPTWPGSPSFIESYSAPHEMSPSNAGRVVPRHDLPPIADKRELLEATDVVVGPGLPPIDSFGGLVPAFINLNIDEVVRRLHAAHWRRREERLRRAPLLIRGPDGSIGLAGD